MKNQLIQILIVITGFIVAGCSAVRNQAQAKEWNPDLPVKITIDSSKVLGKVNPLIFGNNIEAANGKDIFSRKDTLDPINGQGAWNPDLGEPVPEVVELAKAVGMKMLRYPGGCLTHNFDWHKAVGPKEDRNYYKFGIDEYIELCRAIGAEPLMIVSELCSPKDAADLVEYLNMPALPKYPWAMKRAAWGNKEPYNVTFFEMANETYHGNHNVKPRIKFSAAEYAQWYLGCVKAMRLKDPTIKAGGHSGFGLAFKDPWNRTVLRIAGADMDFFVIHKYVIGQGAKNPDLPMRGCMAVVDQVAKEFDDFHQLIKEETGKKIPLAITEYNAGFFENKPIPYRFSFGAALFCADLIRHMLQPSSNVAFANYWHFLNGYWGYISAKTDKNKTVVKKRAPFPVFKLLGQHTGNWLIDCKLANVPMLEYEGFANVLPFRKNHCDKKRFIKHSLFNIVDVKKNNYKLQVDKHNNVVVDLKNFNGERYFDFKPFPVNARSHYTLSFDVKVTTHNGQINPGLGLSDARGWSAVASACGTEGTIDDKDWTHYETEILPLPDAKNFNLVLRLRNGKQFTGKVEFKNITLSEFEPKSFPPYAALTAYATSIGAGKTIKLIVINKHGTMDLPAAINIEGISSIRDARVWTVSAPAFEVITNSPDGAFERLSGAPITSVDKERINWTFPARSISAIEVDIE